MSRLAQRYSVVFFDLPKEGGIGGGGSSAVPISLPNTCGCGASGALCAACFQCRTCRSRPHTGTRRLTLHSSCCGAGGDGFVQCNASRRNLCRITVQITVFKGRDLFAKVGSSEYIDFSSSGNISLQRGNTRTATFLQSFNSFM